MSEYISEKIEQYERKLKQAEKAGKHNKAKKYQEKLERLRAEATSSEPDAISSWLEKTCHGDLMEHFASIVREKIKDVTYYWKKLKRYWNKADKLGATSNCAPPSSATDQTPATTAGASSYNLERSRRVRGACRKVLRSRACTRV